MIELGVVVSASGFALVTGLTSVEVVKTFLLMAIPGIAFLKWLTRSEPTS